MSSATVTTVTTMAMTTTTRPSSPTSITTHFSPSAVLSYLNDEIVFIQRIHIADKDKLLARKVVDSRLIHSIDNLKDVLQMQYLHKLPVEMRYTLYLSIDRLMDYLFLATQRDWPVDRDLENEIGILEQFKAIFAHHLHQIIQLMTKKATTAAAAAATEATEATEAAAKPTEGEYKSFLHLLNVGVSNLKTMTRLNNVADIARFIQFVSYVCNDYNDLKDDLIK